MRTISIGRRPLALAPACAPVSVAEPRSLAATLLRDPVVKQPVGGGSAYADASWLQRVHQVPAEQAQGVLRVSDSHGNNGSTVKGTEMGATKRFVEGARGVPPRGRPV